MVRWQLAKHPTYHDTPWVLAEPQAPALIGFIVTPKLMRDLRVNRSDGLVLWKSGSRIVWNTSGALVARRLDGRGSFRVRLQPDSDGSSSTFRFPSAGCWRLTVRRGSAAAIVIARVIPRPHKLGCGATRLEDRYAYARPRSSGIRGGWGGWATPEGGALLFTHGHAGGMNMKVPWWVHQNGGPSLELAGSRLDGKGSFRQEFPMALSPKDVYPSIVDVPAPGCWLFRLRTGRLAGVLVVRAVDYHG
jgi:hypothetical protein